MIEALAIFAALIVGSLAWLIVLLCGAPMEGE